MRRKIYELPRDGKRARYPVVIPEGWLVTRDGACVLRDPETGDERPWDVSGALVAVLTDGSYLVVEKGRYSLVDPVTREQTALEHDEWSGMTRLGVDGYFRLWRGGEEAIVRLDRENRRFELVHEGSIACALGDGRLLAVEDGRRVLRVDLQTKQQRVLWPR